MKENYEDQEAAWRRKGVLETTLGYNPVNYLNANASSWIEDVSSSFFTTCHGSQVTIMKMTADGRTQTIYEGDRSEFENGHLNKWDDSLYFLSNDQLIRVDPENGKSEAIGLPDTVHAQDLLIYKDHAYVSANQNGSSGTSVRKYDLKGNKVETLVRSENEAQALIFDDSLYLFEMDKEQNLTGTIEVLSLENDDHDSSQITIDFDGTVAQMIPSEGYLYYLLLNDDGTLTSLNRFDLGKNQDQILIRADEGLIPLGLTIEGDDAVILLTDSEDGIPTEIIRYDMDRDKTSAKLIETEEARLDLPYAELSVSVFVDKDEVKVVSDASFVEGDEPLIYSLPIMNVNLDEMKFSYDEIVVIPEEVIEENMPVISSLRNGYYTESGETGSNRHGLVVFPTDDGGQEVLFFRYYGENAILFPYDPQQSLVSATKVRIQGTYEDQWGFKLSFQEISDYYLTFSISENSGAVETLTYYYAEDYTYMSKLINSW